MRSQFTGQSRVAGWIGGVGLVAVGFIVGQLTHSPTSYAQQDPAGATAASPPAKSESATRVVAYIHGSIPITREEYGEFLIARANYNQLEKLVNRRILEIECEKKGFFVTPEEVEAYHNEYVASLQLNSPEDFHKRILPQKNLTMFEWKEDVIKPQLMVMKLLRDSIRVTEKDLQDVYDCRYGPKVDCRMIFLPAGQNSDREVLRMYEKVRVSQEAFELEAQRQPLASLAAAGGQIPPISRNMSIHSELIEKEAFKLQPGDVSRPIWTSQGTVILRCYKHIPPDTTKSFAEERDSLEKEVIDRKMAAEAPKFLARLREQANPNFILPRPITSDELKRSVEKEIQGLLPKNK
jgi:hypothetical protein